MPNEKTKEKEKITPDAATVSVVIPTLNAGKTLAELLSALKNQDHPIEEILVVDSSSVDETVEICLEYENVRVISIPQAEFDHGRTRDMALRQTESELVVFLTQDAVPADGAFISKLTAPLSDCSVAVSVGRQLPNRNATRTEALVRNYNYPPISSVRTAEDIPRLGIKAFFSSDACAAYRRDVYLRVDLTIRLRVTRICSLPPERCKTDIALRIQQKRASIILMTSPSGSSMQGIICRVMRSSDTELFWVRHP